MEPEPLQYILYSELPIFIISLMICALCSFLETSVTALRLFKLKEIASVASDRYKKLFEALEKNPQQVLIAILVASSMAEVTASALITIMIEKIFARLHLSSGLGFSVGIGIGTFAILVFGEVIPKNLAKGHSERWFKSTLWITNVIFYVFYPFVALLLKLSNALVSLTGSGPEAVESVTSEREIRFLIDYINEKGIMEKEKTEMLQSIFNLGHKPVKEIMIPAIDIVMINVESSIEEVLELYSQHQFSRLPIYEGNQDNIIGMIHQKDIFFLFSQDEKATA